MAARVYCTCSLCVDLDYVDARGERERRKKEE